jgi:hypothetical protein
MGAIMNITRMMTSASAIALASAAANAAVAQEATAPETGKYTLSFEGSFGNLDSAPADKWGSSGGPNPEDKFGAESLSYTGAMSLKRDLGQNRDVSLGLTFGGNPSNVQNFADNSGFIGSGGSGYYASSVTNDLSFGAMDVEMGVTRNLTFGDVRFFGGVRGLSMNSSSDFSADKTGVGIDTGQFVNYDVNLHSSFVGVGPRAGLGISTGPKAAGFGLSASVGAAALFGQRKDTVLFQVETNSGGFTSGGFTPVAENRTESQTVIDVDGKLSVDYYFSEQAKVSLGYQARQFWNVDYFSDDSANNNSEPRLVDGVFIGFSTSF